MKTARYIKITMYPALSSFLYVNGYILEVSVLPVYPRASIAIARSDDLLTVIRNSGNNNVIMKVVILMASRIGGITYVSISKRNAR